MRHNVFQGEGLAAAISREMHTVCWLAPRTESIKRLIGQRRSIFEHPETLNCQPNVFSVLRGRHSKFQTPQLNRSTLECRVLASASLDYVGEGSNGKFVCLLLIITQRLTDHSDNNTSRSDATLGVTRLFVKRGYYIYYPVSRLALYRALGFLCSNSFFLGGVRPYQQ